ncbi:NUDIX domain-containing protein [Marinicrinis lubricantis]|uniref:NUDIX domain-containing protein n=1 Tax=Marinicrinis lubricantis TaxID=2086470 RepID=A0ABW1IQT3_9BACL
MTYHVRVRPTALIIENDSMLLVEYKDEEGIHYNLPGGGAEPGETMIEGVQRELFEETMADAEVGPIAFVYECAPHKQSGDYPDTTPHTLYLIFDCTLKEGSRPRQPDVTDANQSAVKWIPLQELDSIILFPNIKPQIKEYIRNRRSIEIIQDFQLERYFN